MDLSTSLTPDDLRAAATRHGLQLGDAAFTLDTSGLDFVAAHAADATPAAWPTHAVFSHGDLHPGHLLVDGAQRITGVLDWTEGKVGDPAIDFALVLQCFGPAVLDDVIARFAAAGGRTWPGLAAHTAALQATFPVAMVEFAQRSGQPALLDMARGMLAVAADAAAGAP